MVKQLFLILAAWLVSGNALAATCEELGYKLTAEQCPNGGVKCPADPSKMYCANVCNVCGDMRGYRYDASNCSAADGLEPAGVQCGGRWTECRECGSDYKYNKSNCRTPKVLAGLQCANSYTQCVYPTGSGCVPTVGYIIYKDGSCHSDYDDTKEAIGIIYDPVNKLALALDESRLTWNDGTSNWKDIPGLKNYTNSNGNMAIDDYAGQSNTDIIVAFAQESDQEHRAAEYCAAKTTGGKKWFLPALGQIYKWYEGVDKIQDALTLIPGATKITMSSYHWSSTENYTASAWVLRPSDGNMLIGNKTTTPNARCSFAF